MQQIRLKTQITTIPAFTQTDKSTLYDLLSVASDRYSAGEVVYQLRRELSLVTEYQTTCINNRFPVLVVVDGINALWENTQFKDPFSKKFSPPPLHASKVLNGRAFMDFQHHSLVFLKYIT